MITCYLAGGISSLSYTEATRWRNLATKVLQDHYVTVRDPMRGKEHLYNSSSLPLTTDGLFGDSRAIYRRDHFDVQNADVMLLNLLGARQRSIGSMIEVGWATAYSVPVVVVIESQGNPHDHPFLREALSWRVSTLEEGLEVVLSLANGV